MKIIAETDRLVLRHFITADDQALFELDRNPNVLTYLNTPPVEKIEVIQAMIARVQKEYETHGVGRVAVVLRETQETIGWAGLKYISSEINGHINYYDLGYRFIERMWGNGYGYEAAKATLDYAYNDLKLKEVFATAMLDHKVSRRILEKIGLKYIEDCDYDGVPHAWYKGEKERSEGLKDIPDRKPNQVD